MRTCHLDNVCRLVVLFILLMTIAPCSADPFTKDINDEASMFISIQQLQQKVSDLEAKSLTTEQKYAAVLSSVLSKTSTLESELKLTKSELNATKDELGHVENELKELKYNESARVHASYTTPTPHPGSSTVSASLQPEVGFEAKFRKADTFRSSKLMFGLVSLNAGGGYNTSTGVFTAPVGGSYMFWFNVAVRALKSYYIFIHVNGINVGTYIGAVPPLPVGNRGTDVTRDGIMLVSLAKNDEISYFFSGYGVLSRESSVGGVLLNRHTNYLTNV